MASIGVNIKIDVTKLDKSRFFKADSGAIYMELTGFIDIKQKDQFKNNGFLTQSVTKDEKDAGTKLPILGNSSVFWQDDELKSMGQQAPQQAQQAPQQQAPAQQQAPQQAPPMDDFDDDIPF